jgi:hypothetical protein
VLAQSAMIIFHLIQTTETNGFDDKFLRFSVKKALDQRLSPLGQFLVKVSRFASTPNVQSEVRFFLAQHYIILSLVIF